MALIGCFTHRKAFLQIIATWIAAITGGGLAGLRLTVGAAPLARAQEPQPWPAAEGLFLKENDTAMEKMMHSMAVKPTGSVDRDFAEMMVPHHQAAVDMAEAELRYGRNAQLLRIAQNIIVDQLQEMAAMRAALGEKLTPAEAKLAAISAGTGQGVGTSVPVSAGKVPAPSGAERSFLAENHVAVAKMMHDMSLHPTGDTDRDFAAMMVPHRKDAVDSGQGQTIRSGNTCDLPRGPTNKLK